MQNDKPKFYDCSDVIENDFTFCFLIGGRGIGKTYSALRYMIEHNVKTMYLRNKDTEIKFACSPEGNPFKKLNSDNGYSIKIPRAGNTLKSIINDESKECIGYAAPVCTFGNIAGADFSDIDLTIYDEFIPKKTDRIIGNLGELFSAAYETMNRNRELLGEKPIKAVFLTNSNSLASDVLIYFGLVQVIEQMIKNGENVYTDYQRSIYIELIQSEISEQKRNTALYKAISGSAYADMALNNDFAFDSFYNVKKRPIKEYYPICAIDDIYIYRHKSNGTYYACRSRADCPTFTSADSLALFYRSYGLDIREQCITGNMYFSEFLIKNTLTKILK